MITPAEQVDAIILLGTSFDQKNRRHRADSHIKTLYHIYNMGKTKAHIYPKTETIATAIGVHHDTVSRFVNSQKFSIYGKKIQKPFISNEYKLHYWVIECFRSLEKLGFMKGFRKDFARWRKMFFFRMAKFYLNKLLNISTWYEVFKNQRHKPKLSTKTLDRYGTEIPNGYGTTRPPGIYEGILRTNLEQPLSPYAHEFAKSIDLLETRFNLKGGELYKVSNSFSLNDIKGGIRIQEQRLKSGMQPASALYSFLGAINESRKQRKSRKLL